MRLRKKWKIGQQKSAGYERRRWDRTTWRDVERSLRRRMRIFPRTLRDRVLAAEENDLDLGQLDLRLPAGGRAAAGWRNPEVNRERRKVIVSIHGRDVTDGELEIDQEAAVSR